MSGAKNSLIIQISKKLSKHNVFHRIDKNLIITKRSKSKVPFLSNDIAYLTGVITGDGTIVMSKRKKGGHHYMIRIWSSSESYLIYINRLFDSLFNYKGKIEKDKRKKKTFYLTVQNAVIFWYFVRLGLTIGKKKDLSVPFFIKTNNKLFLHYLSGLVDTDGHIYGKRIQLKQKSKKLLDEITIKLMNFDVNCNPPKVNYTDFKPFYYIRFDNKLSLRRLGSSNR